MKLINGGYKWLSNSYIGNYSNSIILAITLFHYVNDYFFDGCIQLSTPLLVNSLGCRFLQAIDSLVHKSPNAALID